MSIPSLFSGASSSLKCGHEESAIEFWYGVACMANPAHVAKLKEGVEPWNQWRSENPDIRVDLADANLSGMNLSGADLKRVDLVGSDLGGASLRRAQLNESNLAMAKFVGADLRNANLGQQDLLSPTSTKLICARLTSASE